MWRSRVVPIFGSYFPWYWAQQSSLPQLIMRTKQRSQPKKQMYLRPYYKNWIWHSCWHDDFLSPVATTGTARIGPKKHLFYRPQYKNKSLPGRGFSQHDVTSRHMLYLSSFWLAIRSGCIMSVTKAWWEVALLHSLKGLHKEVTRKSKLTGGTNTSLGCIPLWHHKETTSRMHVWM